MTAAGSRFEVLELLGQGGMGKVFKAYDTRLKRHVALKMLVDDDPERLARFVQEAQAQARVDHENVCRVYEVDEVDGRPCIAMQYIQGEPLFVAEGETSRPSALLRDATVEQKVRLMQRVAEAIHAAHKEGLIHRDVKPSNVMVERAEGGLKPYVLDFGLAREVAAAGVTSFGLAVGTPSFMAPEQARGESRALDRRTDVYGLGATLYALLAGKPPFEGPSSLDVLLKVTEEEPPALTGLPQDLATIVTKCLQKEPGLRYDSARALAEDLGRYLAGEPIQARRTGLVYRLRKKARKHRVLVAVTGVAAAAVTVAAVVGLRAQWRAREVARLAGVFGEEVKGIENRLRIAQLVPEHDISRDKAAIRARMKRIAVQTESTGGVAEGPGHYALGRGYLALKEYDAARTHLQRAWDGGYRTSEVSYALGRTLGEQYQRELALAEAIPDKGKRAERRQALAGEYRDPALDHLKTARGLDLDAPEYVEALIAFYEKRYDEALAKARVAAEAVPWLYEARLLEAQVHAQRAEELVDAGKLGPEARQAYGEAEAAYRQALETGRSDPAILEGLCRLAPSLMQLELYGGGAAVEPLFRRGLEDCDRAVRVDPANAEAHLARGNLLWRAGESEYRAGRDPRDHLARGVEAARRAVSLRPDDARALYNLAVPFYVRGYYEYEHDLDPTESLREAAGHLEHALRVNANAVHAHNALGSVYVTHSRFESRRGGDARPWREKADAAYGKALALQPDYAITFANRGQLHVDQGRDDLDRGGDPRPSLDRADQILDACLAFSPRHVGCRSNRAGSLVLRAEHLLLTGEDPGPALAAAVAADEAVLAMNASHAPSLVRMAQGRWLLARRQRERGQDPGLALAEGRAWARKAAAGGDSAPALVAEARLRLLEGRYAVAHGGDASAAFAAARRATDEARRVAPAYLPAHATAADVSRRVGEWRIALDRTAAAAEAARGLAAVERALAVNPHHAETLALQGALRLLRAAADRRPSGDEARLGRAAVERALALNRHLRAEYGPLLAGGPAAEPASRQALDRSR